MHTTTQVTLSTRNVGTNFGTFGVVLHARTGKRLAESDTVRPYGFGSAALNDAESVALALGFEVVS